jgi:hypothetical protein
MANGDASEYQNGGRVWAYLKDVIQYAILPLLYLGYVQIDNTIKMNAVLLRDVQVTQIRVVETVRGIQVDLNEHETASSRASYERGRVHHTASRSCLDCKTREGYAMPHPKATLLPLPGEKAGQ